MQTMMENQLNIMCFGLKSVLQGHPIFTHISWYIHDNINFQNNLNEFHFWVDVKIALIESIL